MTTETEIKIVAEMVRRCYELGQRYSGRILLDDVIGECHRKGLVKAKVRGILRSRIAEVSSLSGLKLDYKKATGYHSSGAGPFGVNGGGRRGIYLGPVLSAEKATA